MSAKKLRAKLDFKFVLPRSRQRPTAEIAPDFSEKMFRPRTSDTKPTPAVLPVSVDAPPPPPPPKDHRTKRVYSLYDPSGVTWDDVRYTVLASPISEDAASPPGLSDATNRSPTVQSTPKVRPPPSYSKLPPLPDEMGVLPPTTPPKSPHTRTATSRIPVASGRVPAHQRRAATISTPEEAELRRREMARRKEQEEREAMREEAQRQARLKYEKEQLLIQAAHEEEERKAALEEELRRAAEERQKREAIEREADVLANMVAAERKRQDRERRRQETQKAQRMLQEIEEQRLAKEEERKAWRERVARQRRALAAGLETQKTKNSRGLTVLLTGWLTVQSEDCLSYKRRHFQLREDSLLLFKDAEDDSKAMETIHLSSIQRIREWQDGFEDLAGIPNSFALEIRGFGDPWSMFTDSSEDKEKLLALLSSRLTTR
ncbi:hypothetical protein DICSQDRAFT_178666 [Dichomitus squalens LYAD-421 SS1]|uniref:PH domain-containing protein n=1 Tax=Dichomitus squalens TaxID=114155 RepID=A0A4Q9MS93_9APHY|nr:uncharacterized protein DICSQDRAFT_178666 [Dichomitus squalens LYAD-421 SS1]EJF64171.1 hypothetical protein DICSQDRAFT_178666 [Dichomitus squalens LYAD-421 SS1]TBU30744.1 hypothetical protein BD311DRAFT_754303 [Dichomitus squalens]